MPSSLELDIRERLARALSDDDLDSFYEALVPSIWNIEAIEDAGARALLEEIATRFFEHSSGHITDSELLDALSALQQGSDGHDRLRWGEPPDEPVAIAQTTWMSALISHDPVAAYRTIPLP